MIQFSKKNIEIKTLGERLRAIREKAGVSIEEIAKVTKINKRYLQYIENDEYDNLPSNVYVKGFLRSYSNFLGIEAEDVLRIYKKESGIQSNIKKPSTQDIKRKKIKILAIVLPFKVVTGVLAALVFLGVAWYFYVETGKFSEVPRLLLSSPINNAITEESSTEIIGVTDIGNQVVVNGQPIFVNEKGEFKERISLKEGINKLTIKAVNKFNKEIEKKINLSAQYDNQMSTGNIQTNDESAHQQEIKNDKIKVVIQTKDNPVWVSVKVDGVKQYSGTMLSGAEQIFEGEKDIAITSGMANQTFVKINDESDYHQLADSAGVIRDVMFRREKRYSDEDDNKNSGNENIDEGDLEKRSIENDGTDKQANNNQNNDSGNTKNRE